MSSDYIMGTCSSTQGRPAGSKNVFTAHVSVSSASLEDVTHVSHVPQN